MTRQPWEAPRTAYLLTAALAESDKGACGALWDGLDEAGQAGVLAALGAQARLTLSEQPGEGALMADMSAFAQEVCSRVTGALPALLQGRRWDPPPCPHCRELLAGALAAIIAGSLRYRGMSPELIAHHCRQAARTVQAIK